MFIHPIFHFIQRSAIHLIIWYYYFNFAVENTKQIYEAVLQKRSNSALYDGLERDGI